MAETQFLKIAIGQLEKQTYIHNLRIVHVYQTCKKMDQLIDKRSY